MGNNPIIPTKLCTTLALYSGTSDRGPSEIGTLVSTHNTLVYYLTSEIGMTSLQGTKSLTPWCPLLGGSTATVNRSLKRL